MVTKFRFSSILIVFLVLFTQCRSIDEALAPRNPDYHKRTTKNDDRVDFEEGEVATDTNKKAEEKAKVKDLPSKSKADRSEDALQFQVVEYAKQFIGTKYKYGGKSPSTGFDCSGFTRYVMDNFDVSLPPVSRYQEQEGKKVSIDKVEPGDLVFFRRSRKGKVFHVALVTENSSAGIKVVHSTNRGVVLDNITNNSYWAPKLSSARRVLY